jgi:hypothetical protein
MCIRATIVWPLLFIHWAWNCRIKLFFCSIIGYSKGCVDYFYLLLSQCRYCSYLFTSSNISFPLGTLLWVVYLSFSLMMQLIHLMVMFHLFLFHFCCNYDPSKLNQSEDVMSLNAYSHILKENLPIPSRVRIKKWNYDATNKFQHKWITNLHIVKCRICIEVERKDKLLVLKWDFFG